MPSVTLHAGTDNEVVIAYDELGEAAADPLLLIAGCGQPAFACAMGAPLALAQSS